MSNITTTQKYEQLLGTISSAYELGRVRAANAVNSELVRTYWIIGQYIVEFEQGGMQKADYGKGLLEQLSRDLTLQHGRGFSRSNLIRFRQFYLVYPICATLSHQLGWSHIVELLKIENDLEREFYEKQTVSENWSVRELQRQKESALFLRLSVGKNKQEILDLSKNGQIIEKPTDILKDPYIFEFLKIPEPYHIAETQLESLLCDNLQSFLLELGKGFTFVGRQYRVTLNNTHYKVDLVFYHRILRCFVLIDLKINEVKHHDIGQMNMYLGYFANEQNIEGDNPPIGIILSKDKDELLIEYATYGMNSQLFVQKYQLYLPNQDELRKEIEDVLNGEEIIEKLKQAELK
ncbi:MAG: PDDEXK nuclease domain-containing protein [Sulfuricurvum sp.]|nr:PDDEXK nuclease domain-containing protein [Sulfuricurvum sp.]MDP3021866.1 PDDEXK nuclease domain-containing protein [Sulfuricurvum sp.]